ncbi:MAG TPA: hypothetical protein VN814_09265 [Caulobacteraceae bacterium]|nr:hypothetical protein [Caulobacteraceae bacterium]
MPLVRSALIATAACLLGAAAYAQPTTTDKTAPPAASSDMNAAPPANAGPAPDAMPSTGAMPATTAQTGAAANTSATVDANGTQVIASQPVPDTPANRAAYGQPLSHAGKHTAPKGN